MQVDISTIKIKKKFWDITKVSLVIFILILSLLMGGVYFILNYSVRTLEEDIVTIRKNKNNYQQDYYEYQNLQNEIKSFTKKEVVDVKLSEALEDLGYVFAVSTIITSLNKNHDNVSIEGYSYSNEDIALTLDKLTQSPFFEEIKINKVIQKETEESTVYEYSLELVLAKMKSVDVHE